jgi:hypothetical protein
MGKMLQKIVLTFLIFSTILVSQEKFKLANPDSAANETLKMPAAKAVTIAQDTQAVIPTTPQKIAVAVLELDPNGVTESEARALSDRLRIEIFNAGVFEVMERDKMNRILDEMEFQLKDCTTDECAIEVGRLIGVRKIIAGSISKVGEFYTVSARLIDVETSKIEATAIEDIEGTLGIVLTQAMPSVAQKISGLSGVEIKRQTVKTALNLTTIPDFATVYIDGVYRGESPMKIELQPDENYSLRITKEGYEPLEKSFQLTKGQILDMNIVLSKKVEPQVITQEKPKKKRTLTRGFRIKYIKNSTTENINNQIRQINGLITDHNQLFKKEISVNNPFSTVKSFDGIELHNSTQVENSLGVEFGLGAYRGEITDWFSNIGKSNKGYSLVTWSPQVMLSLRIAPIHYPIFYPYVDVGFGYNLLIMNAYYNEQSLGGPVYQSWGLIYGIGFEIRPLRLFGISIEYGRKNMDMRLMDIDKVTDRFESFDLKKVNLTGNRIAAAINLYY